MEKMSSKAERDSDRNPVTFHAARAVLLVLVVIALLFALAAPAEAAGTPTQLVIWTDKKVYTDGGFDGATHSEGTWYDRNLEVKVYAVILDDDGNLMRGRTISGLLNATEQWDHTQKATDTYHHARNPTSLYRNISLSFGDGGTSGDYKANDGIYVAYSDVAELPAGFVDDHLLINISVNVSGTQLKTFTEVLFTKATCHKTSQNTHPGGTHVGNGDPCTVCHHGYEHQFDNLPETVGLRSFHKNKITPVDRSLPGKVVGFNYNLSIGDGTGTDVSWATNDPGSEYCNTCHYKSGTTTIDWWDLSTSTAGDNASKRPSCAWATAASGASCHASTNITQSSLTNIEWTWKQKGPSNSTSHNHTGNKANVSCDICHGNYHVIKPLPNTTNREINAQCVLCHNITGGLNITANGGKNVNHTNPDCKACHMDSAIKLDSHLVPTAGIPGANCTECHDLGGKAPYHIDFNTFNKSDYVHNQYNPSKGKYPLNYNASNGSAVRASENKICWACHGNINATSKLANYSDQPANDHPANYKSPKTCEYCHQNSSKPFNAPQNVAHSNNTNNVRTPGAPDCYDCHGQPSNYNNSNKDPDYNTSREKGLKATLAYHYGTGFPAQRALNGTEAYCTKYCHQNTSSPFKAEFSNSENMQRPNHSARTSRPENQSCVAEQCHAAEDLHGETMKKPTLSSGAFGNANCTGSGCHSLADAGFNYKFHNNVVNCTSCHMDNKGENIHPIKYLQNDGVDFAQVNTTAASCKLCHKNSQGDATLSRWGVTPRKVGAQHHSDDPKNGSKWNKTIDPYWDYVPHEITFVNGWKNNSNRGFITNFYAMNDTNYSAARISENTTADAYVGSHPPNQNFTSSASGWYASGVATTLAWSGLASDGNPAGGITVASTTKSQIVDANWTAAFTYPRSGAVAEGIIKLDSKLVKAANINTGALKVINVSLNDNAGNVTDVYSRNLPNTAEPDWIESGEISIANPNTVFWKNGVYNVTIRTRWTGLGGSSAPDVKLAYDNVFVNISEVDYKKYNFTFYINNTPNSDNLYTLFVGYQTHTEPARLYILNGSSFEYRTDLSSGAFTKAIVPLSKNEYSNGNITLRINDSNGPGETSQEVDVHADYIDIEYMFVESYQWINNSRVHYPCEYCHASNKHYEHALGIPYEFKGNNYENQSVNASTSWCASCHWQGYSSGSKNYNNMVQAFLNHTLPVPPEITGNQTYGANTSKPEYKDHSAWGKDDLSCWGCHKGKLPDGSTSTVFLHNLSTGSSGGRNCTACHNIGGSATEMLVNFTSVNRSMHGNLNKNATGNVSNKPCWGCHGTLNGTWANESDQPLNDHNQTFKQNARKCHDCHNDTAPLFNAKPVTDHIPSGLSTGTDVNTSKYNKTYCAYCHNNSIGASSDPDDLGSSHMNASSAHYGANKTAGKLMSATSNTTDCIYCHKNTSNMAKWGILSGSLSNISNKNGTANTGFNHNLYTQSSQCYQCHGGTVANFHVSAMSPGEKGNPNCAACHNISSPGSYAKVDFVAINQSAHGSLNNKSTSNAGNITNKPCWGCHGTKNGSWANQSDQPANDHNNTYKSYPRKCEECHINGSIQFNAPGLTEHIMPGKNASTEINVTEGYCTVCHNNSITSNSDSDSMGIFSVINASAAHYAKDANANLMTSIYHSDNCTYCHFVNNGSSAWLTPRKPLTSKHTDYNNGTSPGACWGCHVDSPAGEPSTFHVVAINKGTGSGPNCRSCHNTSDTDTGRGHIDGNVFNTSIHGSMNTTGSVDLNEPCWGCHGSGESEGHNTTGISGKGTYKNPFNCTDCHISGGVRYSWALSRNALNVAEHYTNGAEIKASYNATATFSCLKCHQDIGGELRLNNSDSDNNKTAWTSGGDNYNSTIGGNNSPYHYGRKRSDLRSGVNASCDYCHRNSSSAFPLTSSNMSIYEHTNSGTRNTSAGSCTGSKCHSQGFIHNTTLTKPAVQNWTANSKDYCAPCHKVSDSNATKYVYAHNTSNISVVSMDCGWCHNASSQGAISSGALKLHTGGLTNTSTTNSTCVTCHKDSKYVGTSRVIRTHYPGAPAGKANTSLSTWDCEECHGWTYGTRMHNQSLIKKPSYDCNACHNAGGGSSYKSNPALFVNVTRHDNTSLNGANVNCNTCHNSTNRLEPFHFTNWSNGTVEATGWGSWINGTRANCTDCHVTYANQAPFYAEPGTYPNWHKGNYGGSLNDCYQCHSNLTVLGASDTKAPVEMHNVTRFINWSACNTCHANKYGGAPKVDNATLSGGMHAGIDSATTTNIDPACKACHGGNVSTHKNSSANACTYCHITGKLKYTTKNVSEHILNGTYVNTSVNTSRYQQVFCDLCHNNSIASFNDDTLGTKNATTAHYGQNKSVGKLMSSSANSTDCVYCHKNSSNMAKWGVLSTSKANISNRGDHASYSTNTVCYDCHVDTRAMPLTFHAEELNQGSGSSPNCMGCHNTGSSNKKVDFTATNDSSNIHKNLNSAASAAGYDSANKPCWACHGNGTATAHIDNIYKAPRICESCHINASAPYGAPQVREHYSNGSDIKATNATNNTRSCLACHQNISEMRLSNNDADEGTFDAEGDGVNGTGISAYHYGKRRSDLRSGVNTSCTYCHQNSSAVFPLTSRNKSIYEHTDSGARNTSAGNCTGSKCHASGFIHNSTLTKPAVQAWTSGKQDYCAPCHRAGDTNATKYVYSHNTSATPIDEDCGFCHNASSQGAAGSTVKVHTSGLTNNTSPVIYGNCSGCHNGTSLYVGAGKQILSHMPNASQYRGNTSMSSYTCEYCHNMSGKPSMHSTGMTRSNGTCDTCHFTRTSPYNATKKIIATVDYNHTYAGQKTCSIAQCHNASNGSIFHMDKYAAGVVAEPEKFNSVWNDRYTIGFTDTSYPYVDCIDCHREHNNIYPFNNTYPFNYSTNYSFNYEANHTGENKKLHSSADLIKSCYNCHTNRTDDTDRYMVHNVTIEPLVGGPACIKCHNLSATSDVPSNKRVNHTALNQSVHKNLTNFTAWDNSPHKATAALLDSACWTCHATDITSIPGNEHPDRGGPSPLKPAFQCVECHAIGGAVGTTNPQVYQNATKVYKHYPGAVLSGQKIHSTNYTAGSCQVCHNNSIVFSNISADNSRLNSTVSHYANTSIGMMQTGLDDSCSTCHFDNTTSFGVPKQLGDKGKHSMERACQGPCHNPYYYNGTTVNPIILHNASLGIYYDCYKGDCHVKAVRDGRGGTR